MRTSYALSIGAAALIWFVTVGSLHAQGQLVPEVTVDQPTPAVAKSGPWKPTPDRGRFGFRSRYETIDEHRGGLRVVEIFKGGPADQAGFVRGDLIIAIDGEPLSFADELERVRVMDRYKAGQTLRLDFLRRAMSHSLDLKLQPSTTEELAQLEQWMIQAEARMKEAETFYCSDGVIRTADEMQGETFAPSRAWRQLVQSLEPGKLFVVRVEREKTGTLALRTSSGTLPRSLTVHDFPGDLGRVAEQLRPGDALKLEIVSETSQSYSITPREVPGYLSFP